MEKRRFNQYFDTLWWLHIAGFLAVGVLPMLIPWSDWHWVALLMGWGFVLVEYASKAVGRSTLTAWVFWRLEAYTLVRILLGVLIALIAWERLPEWGWRWLTFNHVVGLFLAAWLPMHYTKPGFRGLIEKYFYRWFGIRLW